MLASNRKTVHLSYNFNHVHVSHIFVLSGLTYIYSKLENYKLSLIEVVKLRFYVFSLGNYMIVRKKIPEFIVPDLTGFEVMYHILCLYSCISKWQLCSPFNLLPSGRKNVMNCSASS